MKEVNNMFFIYSYKEYTITHNVLLGKCYITYPNELEQSIECNSLKKAYSFVDEMELYESEV